MPLKTPSSFPFGAVYLLEPEYPWAEVERDVHLMREHGFNHLTLWPAANSWLAKSLDEFVFTDTLRFLDLAHAHGMTVLVQLIGQNQSQEYAPDCHMRPDMLVQDWGLGSSQNCFWANLNHPDVDALVRRYLEACIGALRHHPAVCGWDLFNEAHFRSDDPHTEAAYRAWLRARYGSIDALNRKWLRRYRDFDEVMIAQREASYSIWSSVLPSVEFETFRAENLTAICRRWAGYAKALDPDRPVVIDGTSGHLLEASIIARNNDEFETARTCDIFGGTFYPKSWGRDLSRRPWELLHYYGMTRAAAAKAGKPYHINELQTHTQSVLTPGSEMSRAELKLYIWAAIAAGVEAIQLWRWRPFLRGYQSTGRGLTRLDGTPGPRAEAVAALVRDLRAHEQTIVSARPVGADVKIAVGYRARLLHDFFGKWRPSRQPESVRGWHRLFCSAGLAAETTSVDHLDADDAASPLIVLPAVLALSDAQISWLETYVREGGWLIAEARLNVVDTDGVVRSEGPPGAALSRVFGVTERDVGHETSYEWDGLSSRAAFMTQRLEIAPGARVLASDADGAPMVVAHRYGRGGTLYFAGMQGLEWHRELDGRLVEKVLAELPLAATARRVAKPEDVIVRWHENATDMLAYVMNFGSAPAALKFSQPSGAPEVLFGDGDATRIASHEVCLLRWKKSS